MPIFLSDIPALFRNGYIRLDAALIQVSPPDKHGFCSLGTSVDAARAAADTAPLLIAEVNRRMSRTHGQSFVPIKSIAAWTETDRPLYQLEPTIETDVEASIGQLVADLIKDGSVIQLGIGAIPSAISVQVERWQWLAKLTLAWAIAAGRSFTSDTRIP